MIDKTLMMGRIRALQRALDELTGMVGMLPDDGNIDATPTAPPTTVIQVMNDPDVMTPQQVMKYLGIAESTFYTWVRDGRLPPGEIWGPRMRRWRRSEIENWRKERVTRYDLVRTRKD